MQEANTSFQHGADVKTSVGEVSPQIGAVSLYEDPDSQLGLRGSSMSKPRTIAELHERWNDLPDEIRERAVHELKVGRPRPCVDEYGEPRFPTAEEVGIRFNEAGKVLLDLTNDPTLERDSTLNEALLDKSPEEIVDYLKSVDDGTDPGSGYLGDTVENLMAHDVDHKGGGGSKNKKTKKPAPTSIIERTAAYASEKSVER